MITFVSLQAKTELRKVTEEYITLKEEHNKATESIARLEGQSGSLITLQLWS